MATKTLSGTYEGPTITQPGPLSRGTAVEIIDVGHDSRGEVVLYVVAGERVHVVFAKDVRIK